VKSSLRLLALAVLALATCLPANLFAATADTQDGNPNGPLIVHPAPLPPDGNPNVPPNGLRMAR